MTAGAVGWSLALGAITIVLVYGVLCARLWHVYLSRAYDSSSKPRRWLNELIGDPGVELTEDGVPIEYRFVRGRRRVVIVLAGGYRARMEEIAPLAVELNRRGYPVVMFNWRGTGDSKVPVTCGVREQLDLHAICNVALREHPQLPVAIVGMSLGASVAMMVTAKNDGVDALWLDCPFLDCVTAMSDTVRRRLRVPGAPFAWTIVVATWLTRKVWLPSINIARAASQIRDVPTLVVVSGRDSLVPIARTKVLRTAGRWDPERIWYVPDVGHVGAYDCVPEAYVARIDRFLSAVLSQPETVRQVS